MPQGERKVPNDAAMIMTGVAVFLDFINIAVELIPVVGIIVGFLVDLLIAGIFYVWFAHYEVKLYGSKNMAGSAIAFTLNALPVTDLAFPWAIRVGSLAFSEKKDAPNEASVSVSSWPR